MSNSNAQYVEWLEQNIVARSLINDQLLWQAWEASRQALVVELPPIDKAEKPYACYEGGWNDMRREAVEAIEAAGMRIAP